jgi:sulfite reductase (NADPH) flavoprotein alpha-component
MVSQVGELRHFHSSKPEPIDQIENSSMTVSLIPETAPFNAEQRAWLNGFFAGLLGMSDAGGDGAAIASLASGLIGDALPGGAAVEEEEDFPWHDPSLEMDERLALAEGQPHERRLMAAMAQLDCGACGYVCQTYAEALARGEEGDLTRCSPGGGATAKKLKELIQLYVPGDEPAKVGTSVTPKTAQPPAKTETVTYSRQNHRKLPPHASRRAERHAACGH